MDAHGRRWRRPGKWLGLGILTVAVLAGCGSDETTDDSAGNPDAPTIVVTTGILGDVVSNLVGDGAAVEVIMPPGANPHDFQLSAREADEIREADVLVVNGANFEVGLSDAIEAAESDGVPVCTAIDGVDTIAFGEAAHRDEEDHSEEEDHSDHEGDDPHFFTDPARMAVAADGLADCIVEAIPSVDTDASDAYIDELLALDSEVEERLAEIPPDRRVLITNHEVFGYFADRYGFEVAGAIIPGGSTLSAANPGQLADLAALIEAEEVHAIFVDTSSSSQLAEVLAAEVGDVAVVGLFSESLGSDGGETYVEMVRTNAERIAKGLG